MCIRDRYYSLGQKFHVHVRFDVTCYYNYRTACLRQLNCRRNKTTCNTLSPCGPYIYGSLYNRCLYNSTTTMRWKKDVCIMMVQINRCLWFADDSSCTSTSIRVNGHYKSIHIINYNLSLQSRPVVIHRPLFTSGIPKHGNSKWAELKTDLRLTRLLCFPTLYVSLRDLY